MMKRIAAVLVLTLALAGLAACEQLDVIGNDAIRSFAEIVRAAREQISEDDNYGGWALRAPDGSATFIWSKDFSRSSEYDVLFEIDAQPFLDAGMDGSKLPPGMLVGDKLVIGTELGTEALQYNGEATAATSMEQLVRFKREQVSYHAAMDHFGVSLGDGNVFEWAKDMSSNDKDIVFALNPQLFLQSGVDPNQVEGWLHAQVETMDANSRMVTVDKFLKPFSLP